MLKKISSILLGLCLMFSVIIFSGCSKYNEEDEQNKKYSYTMEVKDAPYMLGSTTETGMGFVIDKDKFSFKCNSYTVIYDISDCECFESDFEICYYDKNNKDLKAFTSYELSSQSRKIKFTVVNYAPKESERHYDESYGKYIYTWIEKFSGNIMVIVKCKGCEKVNDTFEIAV